MFGFVIDLNSCLWLIINNTIIFWYILINGFIWSFYICLNAFILKQFYLPGIWTLQPLPLRPLLNTLALFEKKTLRPYVKTLWTLVKRHFGPYQETLPLSKDTSAPRKRHFDPSIWTPTTSVPSYNIDKETIFQPVSYHTMYILVN